MESRQFNVVFCRRWLLTSVSQASTTTARVSVDIVSTVCDLTCLAENTTTVFSTCQLNGTWSPVSLTCMSVSGLLQGKHYTSVTIVSHVITPDIQQETSWNTSQFYEN